MHTYIYRIVSKALYESLARTNSQKWLDLGYERCGRAVRFDSPESSRFCGTVYDTIFACVRAVRYVLLDVQSGENAPSVEVIVKGGDLHVTTHICRAYIHIQ